MSFEGVKKDVTFFANNEVSRQAVNHLAETLRESGFEVRITDQRFREAEIGIYPSPGRTPYIDAELSIAMFHGIDAGYAERYWPYHDWSQFDLGFLPSQAAAETWQRTSDVPHARPEMGMYVVGWPKADFVFTEAFDEQVEEYRKEYDIGDGKTIIYAPVAESRGKIHEFVRYARDQADNLLIKHGPFDGGKALSGGQILEDVYDQYRDDEDIYILDESDSIYHGLKLADILVSDMSSPLTDAAVTETVPVSVLNWPQKDSRVPRPKDEIPEFTVTTRSWELSETIDAIYDEYDTYVKQVLERRPHHYYALGESAELITELIESLLNDELLPVEPVTQTRTSILKDIYYNTLIDIERTFYSMKWSIIMSLSEEKKELLKKYGAERGLDLFDRVFRFR
jgi:hypothetical protein